MTSKRYRKPLAGRNSRVLIRKHIKQRGSLNEANLEIIRVVISFRIAMNRTNWTYIFDERYFENSRAHRQPRFVRNIGSHNTGRFKIITNISGKVSDRMTYCCIFYTIRRTLIDFPLRVCRIKTFNIYQYN